MSYLELSGAGNAMIYGSVCSGVEAATLAWEALGWKASFFSEIEAFPSEVLKQRWPGIPNLGDFTKITENDYDGNIDLLTGGTPCQAFSVAGTGGGMEDQRGQLSLEFAKLAFRSKAKWIVWENVPGVLSSNKGKDFASFLSLLCGWDVDVPVIHTKQSGEQIRRWRKSGIITPAPGAFGLAWRTLDAQFIRVDGYNRAVPQRRRRLFLVGYIGDWVRPAAVLFDKGSLSGYPAPKRTTRKNTAGTNEIGAHGYSREGIMCLAHGQGNAEVCKNHASTLNCLHEAPIVQCFTQNDAANDAVAHIAPTLRCNGSQAVSIAGNIINRSVQHGGNGSGFSPGVSFSLTTADRHAVSVYGEVRRMTPLECERLMGFPDNHTRIRWRGKPESKCPISHRYKACGNSQCVNAMRWIGMRINKVDKMSKQE